MKMKAKTTMEKPICKKCEYCKNTGTGRYATRSSFFCEHPDKNYISEYFKTHKIYRMFAFIGFGEPYRDEPEIRTSPRRCPKKKRDN